MKQITEIAKKAATIQNMIHIQHRRLIQESREFSSKISPLDGAQYKRHSDEQ